MSAEVTPPPDERDRRMGEAIDAYIDASARGEVQSPQEWARRYPDLVNDLLECLSALPLLYPGVPVPEESDRRAAGESVHDPPDHPHICGYALIQEIGRGGMGVVYKAIQIATKRLVAVKVIAAGLHASPATRRRFEREVELAAALDHPGIVRVLASGESEGHAYCAMEYVEGDTLLAYLQRAKPATAEKLRLFVRIAEAVQYAHLHGVVHRDLKPTNVLVDADGRPRVLDFGLARLMNADHAGRSGASLITRQGQIIGTIPYLSPEHAAGDADAIDIRSDAYALGVMLYEILTGRLPYETSGTLEQALHNICHVIPRRPSHHCGQLDSDIDAVVLKALEKSADKRYQSAADLAEDVRCHLRGEPVEANRSSRFFLLRKTYARHRRQVHMAAAALGLVLIAAGVILGLYLQVRRQLRETELRRGLAHLAAGHDLLAENLLWQSYVARPDAPAYWSLLSYYIQNPLVARVPATGWVTAAAYSPDGLWLALGNLTGDLAVYDARTLDRRWTRRCHDGAIRALAFVSSGRLLVSAGLDGRLLRWQTETWQPAGELAGHPGGVSELRAAGRTHPLISSGFDGRLLLWDSPESGRAPAILYQSDEPIACADLAGDADLLAVGTATSAIRLLDGPAGRRRDLAPLGGPLTALTSIKGGPVEAVRLSSDGRRLAAWSDSSVSLWDTSSGLLLWKAGAGLAEPRPTSLWEMPIGAGSPTTGAPPGRVPHICWRPVLEFSPDGLLLICTGWDAIVRVWEAATGRSLGELRSHETAVYAASFSPADHSWTCGEPLPSRRLAVGCAGAVRVWDMNHLPGVMSWPMEPTANTPCVALCARSGRFAWSAGINGLVHVVSLANRSEIRAFSAHSTRIESLCFDPVGGRLATAGCDGDIRIWDADRGKSLREWSTGTTRIRALACSPDGQVLASGGGGGQLRIWRMSDAREVQSWKAHADQVTAVAFSPDGRRLLTGGTIDWMARLWQLGRPSPVAEWTHGEWVNAVAFAPNGRSLATAGADLSIRVAAPDGQILARISQSHAHWVNALAFVDGGRVLVSGGNDGAIRFWDAGRGVELSMVRSLGGPVQSMAVSEDGDWLAVGASAAVQLIDLGAARNAIRDQTVERLGPSSHTH